MSSQEVKTDSYCVEGCFLSGRSILNADRNVSKKHSSVKILDVSGTGQ